MTGERIRHARFMREGVDEVPGGERRPWVIAHRGYSEAVPENTMAAVDAARLVGSDWIEVDLHVTADGTPVVMHDPTVDRTTNGGGQVGRFDDDALSRLDAGLWAGFGFAGQRVPRLETVLRETGDFGGRLLLELKGDWSAGAVAAVAGLVVEHGLADRVMVQSFSVPTLGLLQSIAPMLERCLLRTMPREEDLQHLDGLELMAYNPSHRGLLMRRGVVDSFLGAGAGVFVWTPDEPAEWEMLLGTGVHGIITNRPGRLLGYLDARFEAV
ncbi:glycerophosphodiester phosphodiesterase [Brevibacterium album]|uniref:glycerophosphodiester phosphodiesterase n=1 Tax=Brevibacterium album TaxID=417948 RepID=UPI00040A9D7A|nr:glycerophosphodiester phosphodiesterase family protein [Brevibacterium album]